MTDSTIDGGINTGVASVKTCGEQTSVISMSVYLPDSFSKALCVSSKNNERLCVLDNK